MDSRKLLNMFRKNDSNNQINYPLTPPKYGELKIDPSVRTAAEIVGTSLEASDTGINLSEAPDVQELSQTVKTIEHVAFVMKDVEIVDHTIPPTPAA